MRFLFKKPIPDRKGTCIYLDFMVKIFSVRIFGYGFVITWYKEKK